MNIDPSRLAWAMTVVAVTSALAAMVFMVVILNGRQNKKRNRMLKFLSRQDEIASLGEIWIEGVLHDLPHEVYVKILLTHKMRLDKVPIESSWLYEYPSVRILDGDETGTVFEHGCVNGGIAVVSIMDEVMPASIETTEISYDPMKMRLDFS